MELKDIHHRIEESEYKPWQVYLLAFSILVTAGLWFDVQLVESILLGIEGLVSGLDWLVILGVQGVIIGFVAEGLYEQGDGYAKAASNLFGSKDRTLVFRIGVMTLVSGMITKVVPPSLEGLSDYLVLQSLGLIIAAGILLVHQRSSDWNWETEWPAIVGGGLLAFSPSLV
ncbi:hypothetical protein EGH22_20575 [Halomicroarcula sp. F28]|uniref:hypothetical protein n=1 Tax=Haloarcula salinisoli TaxID=2487746 RepID=UPI001C735EEC|nr:hypothetical protein [Halomicroarcula salinisoli]MBX0288729.1 hypothetical protein [Halomicroarcula salinisoli]